MDILERLHRRGVKTHYEGCEDFHDDCAAYAEIVRLRAKVEALRRLVDALWDYGRGGMDGNGRLKQGENVGTFAEAARAVGAIE